MNPAEWAGVITLAAILVCIALDRVWSERKWRDMDRRLNALEEPPKRPNG